jgi:hypothetical protein
MVLVAPKNHGMATMVALAKAIALVAIVTVLSQLVPENLKLSSK